MTAPDQLCQLVERFTKHRAAYTSGHYKETQVRRDFIDPFFKLLGWDIDNEKGAAEQYRQVIHEDAIKIGGVTKAPDYAFRIGGVPKFFVEAKKPSVNLSDDIAAAFQLRRYAWTGKLPLSILTDFEEFAVYDCRVKPVMTDKATTARIMILDYGQYDARWKELVSLFSPDAILRGSFDAYADSAKKKRGTAEVDDEFLKDIEDWRKLLAQNMALRNPALKQRELNFVVQRTIDRIVFLRICEDRGIEDYGRLAALREGAEVYPRLCKLFQEADDRYNSGIFHFKAEKGREIPDELSLSVTVDDRPLKEILKRLYYPDSPYEFSVLPAEILGQVYEQFLGSVIHLTAGHHARIEQKPEVRKAGGVYYTPAYIVKYIVENTVGKLLEGKKPGPRSSVNELRILDPACGSGSFLIAAYQYLVDWHRDHYVEDGPEKHTKELFRGLGGEWRLSTDEKKRILLNNIYGVDIDPQAVEVTKLSLLLKVLEGETQESIRKQLQLFKERALPDLGANIKCGNSLIASDFYQDQQKLFDDAERYRINAFDWQREFPDIVGAEGFDAVVGNPPYGATLSLQEKPYLQSKYIYRKGKPETYLFFLDRALSLLRPGGMLGFITPNAWLTNYYGVQVRRHLLQNCEIDLVVDLEPTRVFKQAVVDTAVIVLTRGQRANSHIVEVLTGTENHEIHPKFKIAQALWEGDPQFAINLHAEPSDMDLLAHLEAGEGRLDQIAEYSQGVIPYKTSADGEANKYISNLQQGQDWLPLIESASQVRRYEVDAPAAFVKYGPWLWCSREPKYFANAKILFHRLRKKLPRQLVGAIEMSGAVNRHSLSNLILRPSVPAESLYAVLAIFNSRLINWWFVKRFGLLMEVGGFKVGSIPLPGSWEKCSGELARMAREMDALCRQRGSVRTDHERVALERRIAEMDATLDRGVYESYGLSGAEVATVEAVDARVGPSKRSKRTTACGEGEA